ncbi:uncharacterized protein DEA37_0012317 [Paragonimus westermani]|uniref:Reverse transcriptase domain-containing protein n=1 Tax=Paragonimus westermani TaxID=34504 RepID=A0A5J4NR95_9TREM|nr:uncharacterized protein DEA37_0012317 [Paragonimus westermani]
MVLCRGYLDDLFVITDSSANIVDILKEFSCTHPLVSFTSELESDETFCFQDVSLTTRTDRGLKRSVYHKTTWSGQYDNCYSFTKLKFRPNLTKYLAYKARKICSADVLEHQLQYAALTVHEYGYLGSIVTKHMKAVQISVGNQEFERKPTSMLLLHKEYKVAESLVRRPSSSI